MMLLRTMPLLMVPLFTIPLLMILLRMIPHHRYHSAPTISTACPKHGIQVLAQIPIDPMIAQMVDAGRVEYLDMPWFGHAVEIVGAL